MRARVEIRHRDRNAPRATLSFADGVLTVRPEPATEPVDCHICADPAVHLLLSYGRIGPVRPALTGRIVAWGRRPRLALVLPRLFRAP